MPDLTRKLVAFEADTSVEDFNYEEAWDGFVSFLAGHRLQVVADLDPVLTVTAKGSTVELFEVVSL